MDAGVLRCNMPGEPSRFTDSLRNDQNERDSVLSDAEGMKASPDSEAGAKGKPSVMRMLRWPLIIAGPVIILAVAAYFVSISGRFQTTDNAYVQIAKAPVSASVAGRVTAVYVKENQIVKAGDPLFRLDARDFQASIAQGEAELAQTELEIRSLRSAYQQQQANIAAVQENIAFTTKEAARQRDLVAAGVSSRLQADEAAHAARQAEQQLATAREQAAVALANLGGDPNSSIDSHPRVMAARAKLDRARINQSYTEVFAPADGIVTRVEQLQPGAFVNASQTLFWLLTGQPWIEANFKEDQLAHMRVGQPVSIKVAAFPAAELAGHVASFSPGTGAVFSALPAQNATGNWVKVSQRLPVRIVFDKTPPEMAGRAGLSASVKVDVRSALPRSGRKG
ncbi:HlyD family secretion protein [soil metagenome]